MLGVPVVVPEVAETTALGAAYLAGVATGTWSESDVRAMWRQAVSYEPSMSRTSASLSSRGGARRSKQPGAHERNYAGSDG